MRFGVTTACLNSATIRDTTESVLAQDHPDIELIVVDGASRGGTIHMVRSIGDAGS